jgi:hypothetical protein
MHEIGTELTAAADRSGHGEPVVVVLSYAFSGADLVHGTLAAGTDMACTSGTGIVPLCEAAAEVWRRVEGRHGQKMSRLAVSTVRSLVTSQVTMILASAGKSRWCELATAPPSAVAAFVEIFPRALVVCVYRDCLGVVRDGVSASPWGVQGPGFAPYLVSYPGNSVAALAAYWVRSTEDLLAFEKTHPGKAQRLRYEDVAAEPDRALAAVRAELGLGAGLSTAPLAHIGAGDDQGLRSDQSKVDVPVDMLPDSLQQRVNDLHAQLGYPPLRG